MVLGAKQCNSVSSSFPDGPNSTDIMAAVAEYYEEAQQVEQQEDEEVSSVGLSWYHRRSLSCGAIPSRNTCRTKLGVA